MIADSLVLADAVRATPTAGIACYDGWTLVELGGHVGQIHRWVTGIIESRATSRPTGDRAAVPAVDDLPAWITEGARRLVDALDDADAAAEVWTISRTDHDVAFWRRRMALETALHRWDAEEALGVDPAIPASLAVEGVDETLHVYLEQRLDGRDVGGRGERVAVVPAGTDGWTVTLHAEGIEVVPGHDGADATISGRALDLWLLLTCRRGLDVATVAGDRHAAARAVRAATLVPGPAG